MHKSVLLQEVITGLQPKEGEIVLDATVGDGGHAAALCQIVGVDGAVYGLDEDRDAIHVARGVLQTGPCFSRVEKENFKNLDLFLGRVGVNTVDKILFDLGLRSEQLSPQTGRLGRGFSFRNDEPLLMTFDSSVAEGALTAYEIVNTWNEDELTRILRDYGEERFARRIAKGIVEARKKERIKTTLQLVEIIQKSVPKLYQKGRQHVARKTFQAIRISVNDELQNLERGLQKAITYLSPDGRVAVITFHSLEDRIVKHFFKEMEKQGGFEIITKKPIVPTRQECLNNPRARSAKLRILAKKKPSTI